MKRILTSILILTSSITLAENYLLNGGQSSDIQYAMTQELVPSPGLNQLSISLVVPQDFSSPSYNQSIKSFDVTFSTPPQRTRELVDRRGNRIRRMEWTQPQRPVQVSIQIRAVNYTKLEALETDAPFPLTAFPTDVRPYLDATQQVPCTHREIVRKAKEITARSETEFDAVQQILSWIVDHMTYELRPKSYDAMYSIKTGKGNCQNYSHVAAMFMRAVGIPVRIVNGVTLKQPYDIRMEGGVMTLRMAQGRHSWIEVWFSDLGWVPFDPQQMQLFVSNRFIRVEVGLDNNEAIQDGHITFRLPQGSLERPRFQEAIVADFLSDEVRLTAERQTYGPKKLLFSPPVQAEFAEIVYEASAAAPVVIAPAELASFHYSAPDTVGNLDYPIGIDFSETRDLAAGAEADEMVLEKNFLVETAEYVTTQGMKYAQTFILSDAMQIENIGLALHKFGGSGKLWIEVFDDNGSGKPGAQIATSELLPLDRIPTCLGYDWVDFSFSGDSLRLSPGRYWIALAYTGSPIVNWFFTYGKPVGPADGTRYNTMFDESWGRSLSYEFNYRVVGKRGE